MTRRTVPILLVTLALVGATAAFLMKWGQLQRLGIPGVRLVGTPMFKEDGTVATTNSVFLPERVLDFESEQRPVAMMEYGMLPKDTTFGRRLYTAPDRFQTQTTVVLMGTDRTSIHKPDYCVVGQGLLEPVFRLRSVRVGKPHAYDLPVMELTGKFDRVGPDGQKFKVGVVYLYWFVADGELTASQTERMWWLARDLVRRGVLQRWAYISTLAFCPVGQEEATFERLAGFISAAVPEFQLATGPEVAGVVAPASR